MNLKREHNELEIDQGIIDLLYSKSNYGVTEQTGI